MTGKSSLLGLGGLVIAAGLTTYLYSNEDDATTPTTDHELLAEAAEEEVPTLYDLPLDELRIERLEVKRGDTFSTLLAPFGIAAGRIDTLVKMAAPLFQVNRMRAGNAIAYLFPDKADETPTYFVYESDLVNHVVFNLKDPEVRLEQMPVETSEHSLSIEVTGALWNDLVAAGATPELAISLSEVFAWTVDMHRIQKGDRFTMVYRQRSVKEEPYGSPVLLAVRYEGNGTQEAFLYEKDGSPNEYYDGEGNSLRKAFLAAPVKYTRISSGYSPRRFHPVQKRMKAHLGTDYAAPYGTPINATGDGVVERAGYTSGNGNYVKIRHNSTYQTQYLHMSKILVKQGQRVKQGDVIGKVGSTGLATGPHVCYRFWKNGKQVDCRKEVLPSADPLAPEELGDFNKVRDRLSARLDHAEQDGQHLRLAQF